MASYDVLRDIEMVTQPQQRAQDAKQPRAVSPDASGQQNISGSVEEAEIHTETKPDHEASAMLNELSPTSHKRRYCWWRSIGLISTSILIIATLVIIVSFCFLIILWQGAEDAVDHKNTQPTSLWKMIVFRNWTSRVITICSAAIRTSISLQIGVLVSALAAIMLETSGTRMVDIPALSIERTQSSPFSLFPIVLKQTMNSLSGALNSLIIVTTIIILLVSNLNSTILLSDLDEASILAQPVTNKTAVSYAVRTAMEPNVISWRTKPSAQWRYAETRMGPRRFGDTGRVYRAFLPFLGETERTALEYYSGPAVVANTRTFCVPMELYNFSIEAIDSWDGSISKPNLVLRERSDDFTYECAIISKAGEEGQGWATTMCPGDNRFTWGESLAILDDDKEKLLENEEYLMHKIVVLNTTADVISLFENNNTFEPATPKRLQKLSAIPEGLWTRVYDDTGVEMVAATSCFYNIRRSNIYNVTMTGDAIPREPHWDPRDLSMTNGTYGKGIFEARATEILTQFGIGFSTGETAKRGILKLDIGPYVDSTSSDIMEEPLKDVLSEASLVSNTTWDMSNNILYVPWAAHESHCVIFQHILRYTGDPALAVQSVLTRIHQVVYYGLMETPGYTYDVTTKYLTTKLIPVRWLGLSIVIGMTATHLIQVFVIVVIFLLRTRLSALGNAWQAVAQATHATKGLEPAKSDLDKEVERWAKANGHDKDIFVLSPSGQDGNVELRRRQRKD